MSIIFGIKLSSILSGCGFFILYLIVISMIGRVVGFSSSKSDEE